MKSITHQITARTLALVLGLAVTFTAHAAPGDLPFIKVGTRYTLIGVGDTRLPYVARIVESGGSGWYLVEQVTVKTGNQTETARLWVNFAHVASAQEMPPL